MLSLRLFNTQNMKLIPLLDFVFFTGNKDESTHRENLAEIYNYAIFLNLPLELWMFVPCDEEGNILDEPEVHYENQGFDECPEPVWDKLECEKYKQAKNKCLFDGFFIKNGLSICEENSIIHTFWNYEGIWKISKGLKTINDLSIYGLELTQFSINKIYSNQAE